MRTVSYRICREIQNTHVVLNNFFFFFKLYHLWDNVEKYCRAGEATDDNMVDIAFCVLNATNTQNM